MRVLFLTQTTEQGPSSRVRGYQMAAQLRHLGITCDVSPGVGQLFYPTVYSHSVVALKAPFYATALLKRLIQLPRMRHYDIVIAQKPVLPHVFPLFERLLHGLKIPFVFDLDDALFVRDRNPKILPAILERAAAVTVGNDFLRRYAACFNPRCHLIPSSVDLSQFEPKKQFSSDGIIHLGWIGSRSSWAHLNALRGPLENFLEKEKKAQLILMADRLPPEWHSLARSGRAEFHRWSLDTEKSWLARFDIGLAPLLPGPWSEGKCGYKLVQYLAQGLPVIASPVGVQSEMVHEGKNGFLAATPQEWKSKLSLLISKKEDWEKMGRTSRHLAEQNYSLAKQAQKFKSLLEELCREKTSPLIK